MSERKYNLKFTYILNVVRKVLWISERALDSLHNEWCSTVILKANQKSGYFAGWQISGLGLDKQYVSFGERR
jgi:hypothetical protein